MTSSDAPHERSFLDGEISTDEERNDSSNNSYSTRDSARERLTRAWIDNEIDDETYHQLRRASPERMRMALDRVGRAIESDAHQNETDSDCDDECISVEPAFARLERAWDNDEIDDDIYFQLVDSDEETITAALERLHISVGSTRIESEHNRAESDDAVEEEDDDDLSIRAQLIPAFGRLRRAWFANEIDDDTYFQLIEFDEETITAALERQQIDISSTRTESDSDNDDNDDDGSIPRRPAFARLQRAWYDDDIDDDTYFQLRDSSEELISTALDRLGIGIGPASADEEEHQERPDSPPLSRALDALDRALHAGEIDRATYVRLGYLDDDALFEALEQLRLEAARDVPSASEDRTETRISTKIARLREENDQCSTRLVSRSCGVCLSETPLRRAVLVSCGHALCLACAEQMQEDAGGRSIDCPFCRARSAFIPLVEDHIGS